MSVFLVLINPDSGAGEADHKRELLERIFREAALATLVRWRHQLTLEIEAGGQTRTLRTPTLFVGNNRLQLARLGFAREVTAPVGQDGLAAQVLKPIGTWAMLGLLLRGALGRLGEADQVQSFDFRSITVRLRRARRTKVAADGEVGLMTPPLRFEVSGRPLWLMMPRPKDRVDIA